MTYGKVHYFRIMVNTLERQKHGDRSVSSPPERPQICKQMVVIQLIHLQCHLAGRIPWIIYDHLSGWSLSESGRCGGGEQCSSPGG